MLKIVLVSASMALGVTAVQAQTPTHTYHHHRYHALRAPGRVLANGRCNGISYGTGARSCGTATGGPAGGISSRN